MIQIRLRAGPGGGRLKAATKSHGHRDAVGFYRGVQRLAQARAEDRLPARRPAYYRVRPSKCARRPLIQPIRSHDGHLELSCE